MDLRKKKLPLQLAKESKNQSTTPVKIHKKVNSKFNLKEFKLDLVDLKHILPAFIKQLNFNTLQMTPSSLMEIKRRDENFKLNKSNENQLESQPQLDDDLKTNLLQTYLKIVKKNQTQQVQQQQTGPVENDFVIATQVLQFNRLLEEKDDSVTSLYRFS